MRVGQTIGLLDGDLVTADDDRNAVIEDLLGRMELGEREIVTMSWGFMLLRAPAGDASPSRSGGTMRSMGSPIASSARHP